MADVQNSLDRGRLDKLTVANVWGPGFRNLSEVCAWLFFPEKNPWFSKPGLSHLDSVQLSSTRPPCKKLPNLEPKVLQSGFGVHFLFWPGEFWENCRRISDQIMMVNSSANCLALFSRVSGPPPPRKFTPKLVGIPLQFHCPEPNKISRRFSAYGGDRQICLLKSP